MNGMMDLSEILQHPMSPEEKEHHERLERRVEKFVIRFADGHVEEYTNEPGGPDVVREGPGGIMILILGEDTPTTHEWEEQGASVFHSWSKIDYVEHSWWIADEKTPSEVRGQYL